LRLIVHERPSWCIEDHLALRDYLDSHELLGDGIEVVSGLDIDKAATTLERPDATREEKKRALILLAHHRSPRAAELLRGQLSRIEPELRRFARFAYEEATQWAAGEPAPSLERFH
jgi:hypothetical protein